MRSVRHWTVWVMCVMCVGVPRAWGEVAAPETVVADPIDQIAERDNLHLIFAKFGRGVSNLCVPVRQLGMRRFRAGFCGWCLGSGSGNRVTNRAGR